MSTCFLFQANQDQILIHPLADWDQRPLIEEVFSAKNIFVEYLSQIYLFGKIYLTDKGKYIVKLNANIFRLFWGGASRLWAFQSLGDGFYRGERRPLLRQEATAAAGGRRKPSHIWMQASWQVCIKYICKFGQIYFAIRRDMFCNQFNDFFQLWKVRYRASLTVKGWLWLLSSLCILSSTIRTFFFCSLLSDDDHFHTCIIVIHWISRISRPKFDLILLEQTF